MLTPRNIARFCFTSIALCWAVMVAHDALAQVSTGTVSLDQGARDVLEAGKGAYVSFRDGAILAGISGIVTTLVAITKVGAINDWIVRKNLKWIRLSLGIVVTGLSSALVMIAEGKDTVLVVILSIGTALSSPGLAELVKYLKKAAGGAK